MPQPGQLAQVIDWAHHFLAEVVRPGDRLLDLTAGNGHDTLFLANLLAPSAQLLAFDIQPSALEASSARLVEAGFSPVRVDSPSRLADSGLFLIQDSHANLASYLQGEVRAAIANLGYLPGGDKSVKTSADSTLGAVRALLPSLSCGGRLAMVVYRKHPGGEEESRALEEFTQALPPADYDVLRLESTNRKGAPYLLLVEKRPAIPGSPSPGG